MARQLVFLLFLSVFLGGCSGSIYSQKPVQGVEPVAITVDARQRVLLSQRDNGPNGSRDPTFRRYCAEPSPDVFTVLGVAASASGNLATGADKSVNAALQAAFSSSETGSTIARTQTLNMLREMMFRTCERYLSGAITADEFPIISARDQRIMVSILAIEQLTGAVTPRTVGLSASGSSLSGLNPTELVKLLAAAQEEVKTADDDVTAKTKKVIEADAPGGTCATIRKKKTDGTPALTAEETAKLKACDDADAALATSKAKRDAAQARYDDLVAASKKGSGISSAQSGGKVDVGDDTDRGEAVTAVAAAVGTIVRSTFDQDETQLFCIRAVNSDASGLGNPDLRQQCLKYLLTRVGVDQASLAMRYGMNPAAFNVQFDQGVGLAQRTRSRSERLFVCGNDPGRSSAFNDLASKVAVFGGDASQFLGAIKAGPNQIEEYLRRAGSEAENQIARAFTPLCGAGDGM